MTTLTVLTRKYYTIRATQTTNELAEKVGRNIEGLVFIADAGSVRGDTLRGYIRLPLYGMASMDAGPYELHLEDLEERE